MKQPTLPTCPQEQQRVPQLALSTVNVKDIAFLSVDNTQTFENKNLNELYVNEGEQAALATKEAIQLCKSYKIPLINVLEEHPIGHVSLAANYKDKEPFYLLTYEEVAERTEENNGIGERAQFTLKELQSFLQEVGAQMLRPDHSIEGTQGVQLTEPLQESDFQIKVIKGRNPAREAYGAFDETNLNEILKILDTKSVILSGVATDYCVGKTALDANKLGYATYLVEEAIRGVAPETTQAKIQEMTAA